MFLYISGDDAITKDVQVIAIKADGFHGVCQFRGREVEHRDAVCRSPAGERGLRRHRNRRKVLSEGKIHKDHPCPGS